MPIKPELRWFYPIDWPQISRQVRFERAGGRCQTCGRPHGETVRCLPDGRWHDAAADTWRNRRGRPVRQPGLEEAKAVRQTRVVLAAAHLDHDPGNNRPRNLKSLCQRCHLSHDRPHHLARRRITYLLRRALGDLFLGPYPASPAAPKTPSAAIHARTTSNRSRAGFRATTKSQKPKIMQEEPASSINFFAAI